jgi:hypothetical protein
MTRRRGRRGALAAIGGVCFGCEPNAVLDLHPPSGVAGAVSERPDAGEVPPSSTCGALASRVVTTLPELSAPPVPSDEFHPALLAPRPDGTLLFGYKVQGAPLARVVLLADDGITATPLFETEAEEAHALVAHEQGGALVSVRNDPDLYDPGYCRGEASPSRSVCGRLDLTRFDGTGSVTWETTLTDKAAVIAPDALFIWWFEHTARLVWADDTYGVYFRSARSLPRPTDPTTREPRPTDTLRFVDAAGNREERGWNYGCSPSWSVRLAHLPAPSGSALGTWMAACHGDTDPDANQIVVFEGDTSRELLFLETPPVDRALGGLVPAEGGFWLSYLAREAGVLRLHLAKLSTAPAMETDRVIDAAQDLDSVYVFRAYLARYGTGLLLGWKSGGNLLLATLDAATGELREGPVVVDAPIDDFVEFVSYPNGDVGWAHVTSAGELSVTRVRYCTE